MNFSTMSFRSKLIGTWECLSYTATNINDPNDVIYPYSKEVKGNIVYSSDGYMSAMLQVPGLAKFTPGPLEGTKEQYSEAGSKTQCYYGPFYLDEQGDKPKLYHHMLTSVPPNWIGDTQIRWCEMREEGGRLHMDLGPNFNIHVDGIERKVVVGWRKREPNTKTSPSQA